MFTEINKYLFFTISLFLSISSSFLFHKSTQDVYHFYQQLNQLNLKSYHDLVIAGETAAITTSVFHLFVHLIILILMLDKPHPILQNLRFLPRKDNGALVNIFLLAGYLLTSILVLNFIGDLKFGFYASDFLFTLITIFVIFFYESWLQLIFFKPI